MSFRQKSLGSKDSKDRLKHTKLALTCSKTKIEALKKRCEICSKNGVWCFYCQLRICFTPFLMFLLLALNK